MDEAEAAVSQAHQALKGRLKVALPQLHLAPLIQEFMTRHPEVGFELDFNDRQIDLMHARTEPAHALRLTRRDR